MISLFTKFTPQKNNHFTLFCLLGILISPSSLLRVDSESNNVSLKSGDWFEYSSVYYNINTHSPLSEEKIDYYIRHMITYISSNGEATIVDASTTYKKINVLKVINDEVSFRYLIETPDEKTTMDVTITANPTISYSDPPEFEIHSFLMPVNLEVGDEVPSWLDSKLYINETLERTLFTEKRVINHVTINKLYTNDAESILYEVDFFFDKITGIILEFQENEVHISYTHSGDIKNLVVRVNIWALKNSNLFSKTKRSNSNMLIIPFLVIVLITSILYILYKKRGGFYSIGV